LSLSLPCLRAISIFLSWPVGKTAGPHAWPSAPVAGRSAGAPATRGALPHVVIDLELALARGLGRLARLDLDVCDA